MGNTAEKDAPEPTKTTVMMPATKRHFKSIADHDADNDGKEDVCMYFLTFELQARYSVATNKTTPAHQREPVLHLRSWKAPQRGTAPTPLFASKIDLHVRQIVEHAPTENETVSTMHTPHFSTFGGEITRMIHERVASDIEMAAETGWHSRRHVSQKGRDEITLAVASDSFLDKFTSDTSTHKALKEMMAPHLQHVINEFASSFELLTDVYDPNTIQDDINRESSVILAAAQAWDPENFANRVYVIAVGGDQDFWDDVAATRCIPPTQNVAFASERIAEAAKARAAALLL